jgi:hypothetical protein
VLELGYLTVTRCVLYREIAKSNGAEAARSTLAW